MDALIQSIKKKKLADMRSILESNPSLVNQKTAEFKGYFIFEATPLFLAVETKYLDGVKLLVEKGADVNALDAYGSNALNMASMKNYSEIAKFLLKNGSDVNNTDKLQGYPLKWAAKNGNVELVKLFLERGADKTIQNESNGNTIFDEAKTQEIKDLLKSYQLEKVTGDKAKLAAFVNAKSTQKLPVGIKTLIAEQAGINVPPKRVDIEKPLGMGGNKRKSRKQRKSRKTKTRRH